MWEAATVFVSAFGILGMGWLALRQNRWAEERRIDDRKYEEQRTHAAFVRSLRQKHIATIEDFVDALVDIVALAQEVHSKEPDTAVSNGDPAHKADLQGIWRLSAKAIVAVQALKEKPRLQKPIVELVSTMNDLVKASVSKEAIDKFTARILGLLASIGDVRNLLDGIDSDPAPTP